MAGKRAKPPDAPRKKMGRPGLYTPALAEAVCQYLAEARPLHRIGTVPGMPSERTISAWLNEASPAFCPAFPRMYADAREKAADKLAAECLAIADDARRDQVERINIKTGKPYIAVDYENIQRSRLRFDARRWYASKLAPRKYGEHLTQEISGPGGGPVVTVSAVVEVQQRLAEIRERMKGPAAPVIDLDAKRVK